MTSVPQQLFAVILLSTSWFSCAGPEFSKTTEKANNEHEKRLQELIEENQRLRRELEKLTDNLGNDVPPKSQNSRIYSNPLSPRERYEAVRRKLFDPSTNRLLNDEVIDDTAEKSYTIFYCDLEGKWHSIDSKDFDRQSLANVQQRFWVSKRTEDETKIVRLFTPPSGDWELKLIYTYSKDEKLKKILSDFFTYAGFKEKDDIAHPTSQREIYNVDDSGNLILQTRKTFDLSTSKDVEAHFFKPQIDDWMELSELPTQSGSPRENPIALLEKQNLRGVLNPAFTFETVPKEREEDFYNILKLFSVTRNTEEYVGSIQFTSPNEANLFFSDNGRHGGGSVGMKKKGSQWVIIRKGWNM